MRGITHAVSGAAAYAGIATLAWHPAIGVLATGTVLAAGAATLPDADQAGSCVARSFGWITEVMAWCVHRISGGHREGTHTAVGDVICAGIAALAIALEGVRFHVHAGPVSHELSAGRILIGVYLALLIGAAMKAVRLARHSDHLRELTAVGIAVAMAWSGWDAGGIAWAILIGTAIHAAGDSITKHGVPYLMPISSREIHLLPKRMRISTGHATERLVIMPALIIVLAAVAWHALATIPQVPR